MNNILAAEGSDDQLNFRQQIALRYHRQGFQVVPLHSRVSLMPYLRGSGWQYGVRNTEAEVMAWFADPYPDVGLATGTASSLIVVEFNHFHQTWFEQQFPSSGPAAIIQTTHTFQWFFAWKGQSLYIPPNELSIRFYGDHECVPAPYDNPAVGRKVLKALPAHFPGGCRLFEIRWIREFAAEAEWWKRERRRWGRD